MRNIPYGELKLTLGGTDNPQEFPEDGFTLGRMAGEWVGARFAEAITIYRWLTD